MAHDKFQAGLVQMACGPEPKENLERAIAHVREAAKRGAQVICLPELFLTQYFCQRQDAALFDLAEPIPGPTTARFSDLCRELRVTAVVSLFERRAPGLYHNTAAVVGPDGALRGIYRKMHIPDDPLYFEKYYFTPGDLGFKVFDAEVGRIGTLICWDQWYPEAARLTAMQGAQVLLLSYGHRVASGGKGGVRRGAVRCVANHPARARDRQRRLRCRREPRGPREWRHPRKSRSGSGPGVLGRLFPVRSLRTRAGRGVA